MKKYSAQVTITLYRQYEVSAEDQYNAIQEAIKQAKKDFSGDSSIKIDVDDLSERYE
jgi:hypothetical protein